MDCLKRVKVIDVPTTATNMKVLVVCQHYWPEPFSVNDICESLVKLGNQVVVVTGNPNYPEGKIYSGYKNEPFNIEEINGVEVRRVKIIPRGCDLKGIHKVQRVLNYLSFPINASKKYIVNNFDYDVVLCFQFSPILMAIPGIFFSRIKNVPFIIYCYDLWPEDLLTGGFKRKSAPFKIMKKISKRIYKKANAIAVTSPGFIPYLTNYNEVQNVRFSFIPQYAEDCFAKQPERFTGAENIGDVNIVFAGNIGGNQNIENVVKAVSLLDPESRIRVHVYGSGSHLNKCISMKELLKVDKIVFHGRLPFADMPKIYNKSDALLLSLSGGSDSLVPMLTFPRKLQTYLAAGKPVICCADGDVGDYIRDNECGLASASDNPEELCATLKKFEMLTNDQKYKMSVNSFNCYGKYFNKDTVIAELDKLLKEEVGDG